MKKHVIIIGIVLVGAMVVVVPEIMRRYSGSTDRVNEVAKTPETLNQRIEDLGKKAFNSAQYEALVGEIIGYSAQRKITFAQKNLHLSTLNMRMQAAASITFNEALSSCYSKSLGSAQRIADTVEYPIPALRESIACKRRFDNAMRCQWKLNSLLSKAFDKSSSIELKNSYNQIISNEPFESCGCIQDLKGKIQRELQDFEVFQSSFNTQILQKQGNENIDFYTEDATRYNKLKKYTYYYNYFQKITQ